MASYIRRTRFLLTFGETSLRISSLCIYLPSRRSPLIARPPRYLLSFLSFLPPFFFSQRSNPSSYAGFVPLNGPHLEGLEIQCISYSAISLRLTPSFTVPDGMERTKKYRDFSLSRCIQSSETDRLPLRSASFFLGRAGRGVLSSRMDFLRENYLW